MGKCQECSKIINLDSKRKKFCSNTCSTKFHKRKYRNSERGIKKEKIYSKMYYSKNVELMKEKRKRYYYNNQESEQKKRREYYYRNWEKENSKKNREKRRKYKKEVYRKKFKNKKKMWETQKRKLSEDRDYYIRSLLRSRLNHAINYYRKYGVITKSKSGLIDYQKIVEHLKPFPKNIKEYHIDHIKPLSSFNLAHKDGSLNIVEIRKAFSPKNHQWLKAKENLEKWKN